MQPVNESISISKSCIRNESLYNGGYMNIAQNHQSSDLIYFDPKRKIALHNFTREIKKIKKEAARQKKTLIFFCIGSDRATGDCLGPLVGHMLLNAFSSTAHPNGLPRIYGTLHNPIHAMNLEANLEHVTHTFLRPYIVAIDASLGISEHIGYITLSSGPLVPGIGVQKKLPQVGDTSITGIINLSSANGHSTLQTTHLSTVIESASFIASGIMDAFLPIKKHVPGIQFL